MRSRTLTLTVVGLLALPLFALAHGSTKDAKETKEVKETKEAPDAKVTQLFSEPIPNVPGKSLKTLLVEYAPGGKSPGHRHAASAFIYAQVLSGDIRSQVDAGPARVYHTGEFFYEVPGSHHGVSENASATQPAKLLAVFVVDSNDPNLTTPDPK